MNEPKNKTATHVDGIANPYGSNKGHKKIVKKKAKKKRKLAIV